MVMNNNMRAKMKITSIESQFFQEKKTQEILIFNAVSKSDSYPEDGSDENNTFAKWTPSAELRMVVTNPNLFDKYKVGKEFYVDFTPARKLVVVRNKRVYLGDSNLPSVNIDIVYEDTVDKNQFVLLGPYGPMYPNLDLYVHKDEVDYYKDRV
jgi:hypothetical protein